MRTLQRGVTLIEVLVSVLVFGVGLLGLAGLQLNALKFNQTAELRSQAVFLAYEVADRMRASRGDAEAGLYDIAMKGASPCDLTKSTATCTIAQLDTAEWKRNLSRLLPAGDGSISRSDDVFVITIQWSEDRTGGSATQEFSFTTQI